MLAHGALAELALAEVMDLTEEAGTPAVSLMARYAPRIDRAASYTPTVTKYARYAPRIDKAAEYGDP